MFRAITIEREYGSGGRVIAHRVAAILRWTLWDRALIRAIARAAQVDTEVVNRYDESVDSWWHRFNRDALRAVAIQAGVRVVDAEWFDAETVAALAEQVIATAAAQGNCVIVGRGAQCVLQGRPDVFHAFIYGPSGERVSRVRGRAEPNRNTAEIIRSSDYERARYIRTFYGRNWKDPHLYDLMISSRIGIETAARMIVDAVLRADEVACAGSPGLSELVPR